MPVINEKRKLRLAIIFDEQLYSGGAYQQTLSTALQANLLDQDWLDVLSVTTYSSSLSQLVKHNLNPILYKRTPFKSLISLLCRLFYSSPILFQLFKRLLPDPPLQHFLNKLGIDIVYFLSPTELQYDCISTNYISTVWDLCHLDQPEFPEVRLNNEHNIRQKLYEWTLPRSCAIIADSLVGKNNIVHRYRVSPDRVHISPFRATQSVLDFCRTPNDTLNIQQIYNIRQPYIFYPAQFWAHKNHVYILESIAHLKDEYGVYLSAVFTGSDKGNLSHVKSVVQRLDIEDRIHFLGFVPNEHIPHLYLNSLALVMPTYFGLTNLPPLEAFKLGVPVLYSDLPLLRDQVLGAATLLDLRDPRSLSSALLRLLQDPLLRDQLIQAGSKRYKELTSDDDRSLLLEILHNHYLKLSTWQ